MEVLQRTETWHKQRLGKFTASNIHKLMGEPRSKAAREAGQWTDGAMTYIMEKASEIISGISPEVSSKSMEWGEIHEADAIEYYELEHRAFVEAVGFVKINNHSGGSPDGLVGANGMIEVKCPYNTVNHLNNFLFEDLKSHKKEYYWQIQMNLLATGREWCDYVSYDPRCKENRISVRRIDRNEEDITFMSEKIERAAQELNKILSKLKEAA